MAETTTHDACCVSPRSLVSKSDNGTDRHRNLAGMLCQWTHPAKNDDFVKPLTNFKLVNWLIRAERPAVFLTVRRGVPFQKITTFPSLTIFRILDCGPSVTVVVGSLLTTRHDCATSSASYLKNYGLGLLTAVPLDVAAMCVVLKQGAQQQTLTTTKKSQQPIPQHHLSSHR